MKKKLVYTLLAVLLVVSVSAAIVNYMSNTATAEVDVVSPMTMEFANIGTVDGNGGFSLVGDWTTALTLDGTTGYSTSELGVKIENLADVKIEGKYLELTVTNDNSNVDCEDLSSLMFWDTATPIQIAKGYQELSGLCSDKGTYVIYNIGITSLASETIYKYPVKITFGNVAPTTYTFEATLIDSIV